MPVLLTDFLLPVTSEQLEEDVSLGSIWLKKSRGKFFHRFGKAFPKSTAKAHKQCLRIG